MLRLVDIVSKTSTGIQFHTEEISEKDNIAYVVYDTSTGYSLALGLSEDYYTWRAKTVLTSTGAQDVYFSIDNTNLYPSYSVTVPDYRNLKPSLFTIINYPEYMILQAVITRLDMVRRRYPNPGFAVSTTNSVGQNGTVSFAGGFEKKFMINEIMWMLMGCIVEINATSPMTSFWPVFTSETADKSIGRNPFMLYMGIPYDMIEVISLGTIIRCLMAWGILEVDISFTASDSGLQVTFDRTGNVKGWHDQLMTDFKENKFLFKMNHANHAGVSIGTLPFASLGLYGVLLNNTMSGGILGYSSLSGFNARGNTPM